MIPFWKKTDKGGKKKPPKPAVPRTAQQSIPMQRRRSQRLGDPQQRYRFVTPYIRSDL